MEAQSQPQPFDGNRPHTEMPARLYIAAQIYCAWESNEICPSEHDLLRIKGAMSAADNLIAEHNATLQTPK